MKKVLSIAIAIIFVLIPLSIVLAGYDVTPSTNVNGKVQEMGKNVLGYVQYIGYAIALGMLIYVGIRYTMASANEKADLKKASINYVIGAIVITGASGLFGLLTSISGEVVGSSGGEAAKQNVRNDAGGWQPWKE